MTEIDTSGPISWRNWRAFLAGDPMLGIVELSLFSDAWFIAEARSHGPYDFVNPVTFTGRNDMYVMKPAIVLRVQDHMENEHPDMRVTADEDYHGGWLFDEIAALSGLILGARISAGPVQREFGFDWREQDPLGRPRTHTPDQFPSLPPSSHAPLIADLMGQRDLRRLDRLRRFPHLTAPIARTLVKSSRLYQQALWISNSAPEIAWLLLVSALETAAIQWSQDETAPVDRLRLAYPDLAAALGASSDPTVLETTAIALQDLTRATAKFVGFTTTFAPEPPEKRPQWGRFDYAAPKLKAALRKVYHYRSRALHGGTPFPNPMCRPPLGHGEGAPEEVPSGLASGALGATWLAEDTPMLLHTFAHIVRGALLNWWTSIDPEAVDPVDIETRAEPASAEATEPNPPSDAA